jgi:hypothetical protein
VDCALEEAEPGDGTMTDDFLFLVYGHHGSGRFAWRHSFLLFLVHIQGYGAWFTPTGKVKWGSRL